MTIEVFPALVLGIYLLYFSFLGGTLMQYFENYDDSMRTFLLGLFLNLPGSAYPMQVVTLAVGTPALSMIGAFGAALTVGLKRGGLLLGLLVLPMYIPTLIFGAEVVRRAATDQPHQTPLLLLAAITLAAVALLPFAAAAALRINLR